MVVGWIVANKELLKIIYALAILFICTLIVMKADRLFKISDYQGIRYFRNAFFFFGLSVVVRFILGSITTTNPETYSIVIRFFFEFFTVVASLFLLYSLIWKKIEKQKKHHSLLNLSALTFYLIALVIVGCDWVLKMYFVFYLFQIILFLLILVVAFKNYLTLRREYPFLKVYLITVSAGLVSWILDGLLYLTGENKIIQMIVYGLSTIFFFLFLKGVINLTRNGKKKR